MSTSDVRPAPNDKEAALEDEQRADERLENAREWRRGRDALADAADLRALDACAFALHVRTPLLFDGPLRILWNGWLEDWSEFFETHRPALDGSESPLSEASLARLDDYREVLDAFRAIFELVTELEERRLGRSWRDKVFLLRRTAAFARRHGGAFAKIRASRRQHLARFPPFNGFSVPPGVTRH